MTMNKRTLETYSYLTRRGLNIPIDDFMTLRRASMTLSRWSELECGDSSNHASWAIERNETTDIPYMVTHYWNPNRTTRYRVADREKGALKRIATICARLGIHWYYQGDCRGLALYLHSEPMTDSNYTNGIGVGQ